MEKFQHILRIALFWSAIFLCGFRASAQSKWLELLPGAKVLSYDERTGMQRLLGPLSFTYKGSTIFCDSAHYRDRSEELWGYGKVQINDNDTLNLFCDSLYYNGRTRKAKLWGHVRVRDREYKLTTDTLEYDARKKQAIYRYGGRIENITTQEVLTSRFGYFYPNTEESFFRGNVVYKSPDLKMTTDTLKYDYLSHKVFFFGPTDITKEDTKLFCRKGWFDVVTEEGVLQEEASIDQAPRIIHGDSLYYASREKIAIGRGNISVLDTAKHVEFAGGYLYSDEKAGKDMLTDKPWARMMQSKDTLYLASDTLFHVRDTASETLRIYGHRNVKIFRNDIQGSADSLDYDKENGFFDLKGHPFFWSRNSELRGDSIRVFVKNDTLIEKVHLRYNAFAANEVDSGKYYNQLAGKEIWAYFRVNENRQNELVRSDIVGNARTVSFPTDTIRTDTAMVVERKGMNRVYSADMRVYLDSGEVTGITFLKEPEGIFYPMDQIDKEEQFLQGFAWNPALRPKSWQEVVYRQTPDIVPDETAPEKITDPGPPDSVPRKE